MSASDSVGPGSMGAIHCSMKEGAHPTFPGGSREDREHWGSSSPGHLASPWGQEQACSRKMGIQAGLNQQSPCAGSVWLWELEMCHPGMPLDGAEVGGQRG